MSENAKRGTEFEQYRFLIEDNPELDAFLKQRAGISLQYFIKKANWYKRWGTAASVLNIVLPACATFFSAYFVQSSQYIELHLAAPVITLVATIVAGLIANFKFSEKKDSYRNSAESLKSELVLFYSRAERYQNAPPEKAREIFVKSMEKIIGSSYKKIVELEKNRKSG